MACKTPSVEKVVNKSEAAQKQLDRLQQMLDSRDSEYMEKFEKMISENLKKANLDDCEPLISEKQVKVEYTSEFSIDRIAGAVKAALNAASKATDKTIPNAAMSDDAIQAYSEFVTTVAEAAKSSSSSSSSLSFSMIHMCPGFYSFLYACSFSIKDSDTFGDEGISSTAIYYRMVQSSKDLINKAHFDLIKSRLDNVNKLKEVQAGYINRLINGQISLHDWEKLDAEISRIISNAIQNAGSPPLASNSSILGENLVGLIDKLSKYKQFQSVIDITNKRIEEGYY